MKYLKQDPTLPVREKPRRTLEAMEGERARRRREAAIRARARKLGVN